ncbi:MAG: hypothetical protein AAF682_10905 [Planctomycetota bacterium]
MTSARARAAAALATAAAAALASLASCAPRDWRRNEFLPPPPEARPVVQTLIGVSLLEDGDLLFEDVSTDEPTALAEADYSVLPSIGVSGMQPITEGAPHLGLEGSLIFSWWVEEADVFLPGGGTVEVDVDTALWLTELSIGPYISTSMERNIRLYAGAGASAQFGYAQFDTDDEEVDGDDSSFGLGGYARAGVELRLGDGSLLGLGLRSVHADLDFDRGLPDVDLDALQVFLTYSAGTGPFFPPPDW